MATFTHLFEEGPAKLAYVETGNHGIESGITLPLMQAELMFRLRGDFKLETNSSWKQLNPDCLFFGLFTEPMVATVSGDFAMVGLFLRPEGFYQLTGQSIRPFQNQAIAASDIWGNTVHVLHEQLLTSNSAREQLALLKNFVAAQKLHPLHLRVQLALAWLRDAEGGTDLVFRLAKMLGVSEKTVHADFKREVGLSPVVYQMLAQFQKNLDRLQDQTMRLGALAHELEYYDQAHFIKRFSAFAQMSPGQYRRLVAQKMTKGDIHYLPLR